jgi:hypothetical protein
MTAGTAFTTASSSCKSWVLAADSPTASGRPLVPPSTARSWIQGRPPLG